MNPSILSITGTKPAPDADYKNAMRRYRSALEWVAWYRSMSRRPHLFHFPDGQQVTRAWARNQAYSRIADARSWQNVIEAHRHGVDVPSWMEGVG